MHRLLKLLGNPEKGFSVIHVAGSKGKGTVASLISNILIASKFTCGMYISPHITSFNERVQLSGQPVDDSYLDDFVDRFHLAITALNREEAGRLTSFEVSTAMAFKCFEDHNVDVAVIETGMGGKLDATNVFDDKSLLMTVITTLGTDHLEILGGSMESIAIHKAGISKRDLPVIVSEQTPIYQELLTRALGFVKAGVFWSKEVVQVTALPPEGVTDKPYQVVEEGEEETVVLAEECPRQPYQIRWEREDGTEEEEARKNPDRRYSSLVSNKDVSNLKISKQSVMEGVEKTELRGRFQENMDEALYTAIAASYLIADDGGAPNVAVIGSLHGVSHALRVLETLPEDVEEYVDLEALEAVQET